MTIWRRREGVGVNAVLSPARGLALIRMAVGLLLASAITVAVVASGLDLLPLRP